MIIALHAMQLLHERNNERTIFVSRDRAFNSENNWNKCKLHSQITSSISNRFALFLQLRNALDEFYNFMLLHHYNMCESIIIVNALHERNIKRVIFASRCRTFNSENNWNKCKFHFIIFFVFNVDIIQIMHRWNAFI